MLYFVKEGELAVCYNDNINLVTLGKGNCVGEEMCLFNKRS